MPSEPSSQQVVEDRTRAWLEESYLRAMERFRERDEIADVYDAHGEPRNMVRYHFQEVQRKLKIFRWLDRLRFTSFLDVGSGFDVYPELVRERYGVTGFFSDMVHSMNLPYGGNEFGRLDRAVTMNLSSLPYRDGAFDVVLCSEVLEHLVRPVEALAELMRITRQVLVLTSLEALSVNRWERFLSHHRVDARVPHVERNFLLLDEFEAIFGPGLQHENLIFDPDLPASSFAPPAAQQAAYAALRDTPSLVQALMGAVQVTRHGRGAMGILLVNASPGTEIAPPVADLAPLTRWLVDRTVFFQRGAFRLLAEMMSGTASFAARDRPVAAALRERLRCPDCRRGGLVPQGAAVVCEHCGREFAGEYGVPILYPTRPRDEQRALEEALDRLCGADARRRRVVRRLAARLRRNEHASGPLQGAIRRLVEVARPASG